MESEGDEQESETVIIATEYDGDYETIGDEQLSMHSSNHETSNETHRGEVIIENEVQENNPSPAGRAKYYKQTYRHAWEDMPDFRGWLRGVAAQPTRAYCVYCRKTLHAHRLSLLKHTCTIRHQRAAQIHFSRKQAFKKLKLAAENNESGQGSKEAKSDEEDIEQMLLPVCRTVSDGDENEVQILSLNHEGDDVDDEDFEEMESETSMVSEAIQPKKLQLSAKNLVPISTHVLDTVKGMPVNNLQVSLYKLMDSRWTFVNEATTVDGRCNSLMSVQEFSLGRYKLHFDVGRYFQASRLKSLYPFIEVVFDVNSIKEGFHLPLLISPYGYSTYRGS